MKLELVPIQQKSVFEYFNEKQLENEPGSIIHIDNINGVQTLVDENGAILTYVCTYSVH